MDTVIVEYEVSSRADGRALEALFTEKGYNVKALDTIRKWRQLPYPEVSYYQVWSDKTITWDEIATNMPEVRGDGYYLKRWDRSVHVVDLVTV